MQLRKFQRVRTVAAIPSTNLQLRARANDLALANGAAVDSWAPLTGPTFTQGTAANQPVFRLGAGPNGKSVVEFDGTADFLGSGDATFTALLNGEDKPFTMAAVLRCSNASGGRSAFTFGNSASSNNFHHSAYCTANQIRVVIRGNDANTFQAASGAVLNTAGYSVIATRYDGTTAYIYHAGGLQASVAINPLAISGLNLATIGCLRRSTSSDFFQGFIAELLFYNADLGPSQTAAIQRTLGAYYALPVS